MQKRSWVKRYVMGCIGPASVALSAAAAGGGSSLKSVAVTFGVTRKQIKIAVFRYDVINFLN